MIKSDTKANKTCFNEYNQNISPPQKKEKKHMKEKTNIITQLKRIIALILILTITMPHITFAEESPWLTLPEIDPIDGYLYFTDIYIEDYAQTRLESLLARMSEIETFTAEEQTIVQTHLGTNNNELSELTPEALEEFMLAQEAYHFQGFSTRDYDTFSELISRGQSWTTLTEADHTLIFKILNISSETHWITNELLTLMEQNGHTITESIDLIKIMSSGLFGYTEAQIIYQSIPNPNERLIEIGRFENFARNFNIATRVNERRLTTGRFWTTNTFEEPHLQHRIARVMDINSFITSLNLNAPYSFIETARIVEQGQHGVWILEDDGDNEDEGDENKEEDNEEDPSESEPYSSEPEDNPSESEPYPSEPEGNPPEPNEENPPEDDDSPELEENPTDNGNYPQYPENYPQYPENEENYPIYNNPPGYETYLPGFAEYTLNLTATEYENENHHPEQEDNNPEYENYPLSPIPHPPPLGTQAAGQLTATSIHKAFTNENAFNIALQMLLNNHTVEEIETAFALGAALQAEPQTFMLPIQAQARRTPNEFSSAIHFEHAMAAAMTLTHPEHNDIADLINYGLSIITLNATPLTTSETIHENIIPNPFNLHLNANETVNLNSGAATFRTNILTLPGRGGFGLTLDLIYDTSWAELGDKHIRNMFGDIFSFAHYNPQLNGLGRGWRFDLPYISITRSTGNEVLHLPGRGSFEINGNQFVNHTLQDMQIFTDHTFISGHQRSNRRLTFHNGTSYYFADRNIIGKVDRYGNTIRFEYGGHGLTRIVDSNNKVITIQYSITTSNRTATITSPDGSTFIINMTRNPNVTMLGSFEGGGFQIDNIRNQVGETTSFIYDVVPARFCFFCTTQCRDCATNQIMLLRQVTYPSGAQLRFGYTSHIVTLRGGFAPDHRTIWKTASRELINNNRSYMWASFSYTRSATFQSGYIIATTVTQSTGMRTTYTFNNQHLNTNQNTYNNNVRLTTKTITHNNDRLPTTINLTETRNNISRTTTQHFTYNQHGQITQTITPSGLTTNTTYDPRFGLPLTTTFMPNAQTTIQERNTLSPDGRTIIRTYIYENNTRQTRTDYHHDPHGNITEIREYPDSRGTTFITTQITYDRGTLPQTIRTTGIQNPDGTLLNGNGITQHSFTYDQMWRTLTETDPNGYTTRWQHDRIGRITRIDHPNGSFVTYTYNDRQNTLTHRTILGAVYTYQYDGLGNLLTITVGGTTILTNTYDTRMRLTETRNAQGIASSQRRTFTYDIFDRVTEIRNLTPTGTTIYRETIAYFDVNDSAGNARIVTTIHGDTNAPTIQTFTQYDRFGRKTQEGTMGGRIITYTHDLAGRVVTEQSLGIHNTYTHNIFGITSIRNIENNTARNTYDSMGRLIRTSDFMNNYTRFYYDALGRLTQQNTPFDRSGTITRYSITRYFYDRNGNLTRNATLINIPGQAQIWATTENTYQHNRLTASQTGGPTGIRTEFTYDLAGNILTQRVGTATTTFVYSNRGQLIRTTDALGQIETITYDINGLPLTKTDRNGTLFRMTYDNMGRLIRQEAVRNNVVALQRTYTFTATGALRSVTNGTHTITKRYDAQGRLTRQEETGGIVLTFQYNAANNRTQSRVYVNNARHIYNTYTYTTAQRLHTVTSAGRLIATYTHNANGSLTNITLGNGVTTNYTHNLTGLITNVTNRNGTTTLSSFTYAHYLDGNVRQITEIMEGATRTITYTYDLARRLTREHSTAGGGVGLITREYQFDNRSNRTRMTVTGAETYTVNYTYDQNNRLLTETRTGSGAGTTTYTYDRNGNQLTKATGGQTETRTYNAFNQLTAFTRPGMTATYTYRADGLQRSRTANGTIRTHVWNGSNIILGLNSGSGVIRRYHRTPHGRLILNTHRDWWYLFNARGDVVQNVNDTGGIVLNYRYTAFGVELNPTTATINGNSVVDFRFGGKFFDQVLGEYTTPHRHLNPRTGRWTQPDPFWDNTNSQGSTAAILQAANLYVFVMNNPVFWLDPSGLSGVPSWLGNAGQGLADFGRGILDGAASTAQGIYHAATNPGETAAAIWNNVTGDPLGTLGNMVDNVLFPPGTPHRQIRNVVQGYQSGGMHGAGMQYGQDLTLGAMVVFGYGAVKVGGYILKKVGGYVHRISITNLDVFVSNPKLLTHFTPDEWYIFSKNQGFNLQPLGHGYRRGIPFESGGGFRINWGSGNYLQFHPGSIHHGINVPYWKVSWSSGGPPGQASGTIRFDMRGNALPFP